MAALRELAGGRADLLAEVAGILEGAHEGELNEPLARQAAQLCRAAGRRPGGDPGVDRRRAAPEGLGEQATVLRRRDLVALLHDLRPVITHSGADPVLSCASLPKHN